MHQGSGQTQEADLIGSTQVSMGMCDQSPLLSRAFPSPQLPWRCVSNRSSLRCSTVSTRPLPPLRCVNAAFNQVHCHTHANADWLTLTSQCGICSDLFHISVRWKVQSRFAGMFSESDFKMETTISSWPTKKKLITIWDFLTLLLLEFTFEMSSKCPLTVVRCWYFNWEMLFWNDEKNACIVTYCRDMDWMTEQ